MLGEVTRRELETCAAQARINAQPNVAKRHKVDIPTWLESVLSLALERFLPEAPAEDEHLAVPAGELIGDFAQEFEHAQEVMIKDFGGDGFAASRADVAAFATLFKNAATRGADVSFPGDKVL